MKKRLLFFSLLIFCFCPIAEAIVANCLKTTLPIDLVNMTGEVRTEGNLIEWYTAWEVNNDYFQLERSHNGHNFEVIAIVNGVGTTTKSQSYLFWDKHPFNGANYYRLSQVDFDGKASKSVTITLFLHPLNSTLPFLLYPVYPNPTHRFLHIEFDNPSMENLELELTNILGQTVRRENIEGNVNRVKLDCSELQKGLYLLKLGGLWEKVVVR
ncbi:MAG: T9SS type A sorting domain-containing protein [Chitinophagales bacterium]